MKRYDISGIYIFDKFPDEEKKQPTCIEDCQEETRVKWLDSLDIEALHRTADMIQESLQNLLDLGTEDDDKISVHEIIGSSVIDCIDSKDKSKVIYAINEMCIYLHKLADYLITEGIIARKEE